MAIPHWPIVHVGSCREADSGRRRSATRWEISEEVGIGKCSIGTWEQLKAELKAQFLPGNVSWMAHHSLMNVRQTRAVRHYKKDFSALMLDIMDMSDEDRFFPFLKGLQPWEQA